MPSTRKTPQDTRPSSFVANSDRKSTPSELQSLRHLVCRLLLEKKKDASPAPVPRRLPRGIIGLAVGFGLVIPWLGFLLVQSKSHTAEASISFFFKVPRPTQIYPLPPPVAFPI